VYPNQEVSSLRKAGRLDDAYKRGRELLPEHPDDFYLKNIFGWVLYDKIKLIADRAKANHRNASTASGEVRALLREYARLELPRPDLLFSLLLSQTLRIPAKLDFLPAFMSWAGLDCFRPEDFQAQEGKEDDAVFQPLVEKAARATAKLVRGGDEDALKQFAIALLDKAIAKGEVQGLSWLQYSKALLLRELGRVDEARALLLPFVREKRTHFWAWHALSKIEERENASLALALCARACLTCNDAKFGLSVFEDVVRLAVALQRFDLAKWSTDQAVSIRQQNDWRIPESLRVLAEADWYQSAPILADPTGELENCARAADRVVYSDCPRFPASFLGTFKARSGKLMVKVGLREGGLSVERVSSARGLAGTETYDMGEPVAVGILKGEQQSTFIELKPRAQGESFDCLDSVYGVVDHQNREKCLVSVYVTATEFCLLPFKEFDLVSGWQPGNPVTIWCTRSDSRLRPYRAEIASFHETEWISRISGEISVHPKGFAFVKDVFVPPHLAKLFEDGCEVSVVAVRKRNKKTNSLDWTAIAPASDIVMELEKYRKRA
jgi:hypothetical protein